MGDNSKNNPNTETQKHRNTKTQKHRNTASLCYRCVIAVLSLCYRCVIAVLPLCCCWVLIRGIQNVNPTNAPLVLQYKTK